MNKLGCLVLLFLVLQEECQGELRLLQIVFHNEKRAPETVYPKDPYKFFWQHGPAKIAMIGMIQLFKLGQRMRRKYSDFVTVQPEEVDLYPSARGAPCSSLSQCFLSGFYKPNNEPSIQGDLSWQPGKKLEGLEKLSETELICPRLQEPSSRIYDSEEGGKVIAENMNLYKYWSVNSGMEIKNPTDARELYKNLEMEKNLNLSTPNWADRFWPELKQQSEIHFAWLAKSPIMQRVAAGPLLGLMIQRMDKHMEGHDVDKKYYVYSGKNSSLAGLLAIFGAFDGVEPPFGSTVVLELHKFGEIYFVRVLYFYSSNMNSHTDPPEMVTLRGCSEYCPFQKFKRLTMQVVPDKWEFHCGLSSASSSLTTKWFYAAWIFVLLQLIGY